MIALVLGRKIQICGVETVPEPIKQFARQRLFQIEFDDLSPACHAKLPWIRIGQRLNIAPAPASAVVSVSRYVINSLGAQSKRAVTAAKPFSVMSREFGKNSLRRVRISVPHRPADAISEIGRNRRRYRLSESETEAAFARLMPVAVLIAGNDEFLNVVEFLLLTFGWRRSIRQLESADFLVRPAVREFRGAKLNAGLVQKESARHCFFCKLVPTCR